MLFLLIGVGWITAAESNKSKAFCKICKCTLNAHKKAVVAHAKTKKHLEAERASLAGPSKKITQFMKQTISQARKIAELKIAAFVSEYCSLKSVDHLGSILNKMDVFSQVLCDINIHRTKCTSLILHVIAPCLLNDLITDVADSKFSLIIDERAAIDCTKMLCVMIIIISTLAKKNESCNYLPYS